MKVLTLMAGLVTLHGCGGGGGGDGGGNPVSPPAATSAEGLWSGTSSSGRSFVGLVLDDGEYWMIYTVEGNDAVIAGALNGTSNSNDGTFSSSNGRDFNFEGLGVNDFTLNGDYAEKQSLDGTIRYSGSDTEYSFSSDYDSDYELTPTLANIAGSYSGTAVSSAGQEFAIAEISSSGQITGSSAGGCDYTGTVTPRARGNVYDISITFGGGVCVQGTTTVTGVAYLDADTSTLYAAALNGSRTDGFLSVGQRS